jgi:hypothetical protein
MFTKPEVRRFLRLPRLRDVDALEEDRTLIPSGYLPNGRELYDALDVRRAAMRVIREEAPPA